MRRPRRRDGKIGRGDLRLGWVVLSVTCASKLFLAREWNLYSRFGVRKTVYDKTYLNYSSLDVPPSREQFV